MAYLRAGISEEEAVSAIQSRIDHGWEIRNRCFSSLTELEEADREMFEWAGENLCALRNLYQDDDVPEEYVAETESARPGTSWMAASGRTFEDRVHQFEHKIERHLSSLASIRERLELLIELHPATSDY